MKKEAPTIYWVIALFVVIGGWYWWSTMQTAYPIPVLQPKTSMEVTTPASAPTSSATPFKPTLSMRTSATLGDYLVAENGMTLYRYTKDAPGVSNCSGTCAINWPPYVVSADHVLSASASIKGLANTITRKDKTIQVTYNGAPLYFWAKDAKPGDTTGQNVGGVWFVVKP